MASSEPSPLGVTEAGPAKESLNLLGGTHFSRGGEGDFELVDGKWERWAVGFEEGFEDDDFAVVAKGIGSATEEDHGIGVIFELEDFGEEDEIEGGEGNIPAAVVADHLGDTRVDVDTGESEACFGEGVLVIDDGDTDGGVEVGHRSDPDAGSGSKAEDIGTGSRFTEVENFRGLHGGGGVGPLAEGEEFAEVGGTWTGVFGG